MQFLIVGISLLVSGHPQKNAELYGVWYLKSGSINGEPILNPPRAIHTFTFGDDNKFVIRRTGEPDCIARFAIGPGRLTRDIDLSPIGGDEMKTIGALGICKLENDCLLIALPSEQVNGKETRPADFDPMKKIILLRLEKQTTADMIKTRRESSEIAIAKTPTLAGKWELVADSKSNESMEIEFLNRPFGKTKDLRIRRKTKSTLFGMQLCSEATACIPCVIEPANHPEMKEVTEGRKNVFLLLEKVDERNEGTFRLIRFYFRGETLELRGVVSQDRIGTINLTGEWRTP